jgi:ABC-type multidrug transport system permease subunit
MMKRTKTETIATLLGAITVGILFIGLQSWILGVVLGWFGITLAFWKCLVIVLLIGTLFGSSHSSK